MASHEAPPHRNVRSCGLVSDGAADSKKGKVVDSKASPDTHYIIIDSRVDLKAPLSKWMVLHTAESEHDCYAFLARWSDKAGANPGRTEQERRLSDKMDKILRDHATCVAADDPRLKEK